MRALIYALLLCSLLGCSEATEQESIEPPARTNPRIIVLTDIENEPDDAQSLVRYLLYSNELNTEGLLATTSVWMQDTTREDKILEHLDAYEKVRGNLLVHAEGYPEADELRNEVRACSPKFGMNAVGEGHDSRGSEHIIEVVDRNEPGPIWVTAWGGANCLAQALWKVRETRSPEEVDAFVEKLRVYTISDQDDSGPWMRHEFPNLFYVVSPSESHSESWKQYADATWSGIAGDRHYENGPLHFFELVDNPWLEEHIINDHGPLGAQYPLSEYIMEGDTPSFFSLLANGLAGDVSPGYGGWGGRYRLYQPEGETREIWTNDVDKVVAQDGNTYEDDQATIWRWRQAYQHDLAARIDWSNTATYEEANHNPVLIVGRDASKEAIYLKAGPGEEVALNGEKSSDPDGDLVNYKWWHYVEAGTYKSEIPIMNASRQTARMVIPEDALGTEIHLIFEATDEGEPALTSYRRIVIRVG